MMVGRLVIAGLFLVSNSQTAMYFYYYGKSLGGTTTTLFVAIDIWFGLDILKPTKPWIRYADA